MQPKGSQSNHGRLVRHRTRRPPLVLVALVALSVIVAACAADVSAVSSTTSAPPQAPTTHRRAPTSTTTTTVPTLAANQVYELVSPAVAFVSTPLGSGSGVLIDDERVVTNAHVVWPYQSARVLFPDGTEIDEASVVALDLMGDIAVLDVASAPELPSPATFEDGSLLPFGTDLFLIGYPLEGDDRPRPTITGGLLSQVRSWDAVAITYLQTDAVISPGQSGGALVSPAGGVVGISGFGFDEFALAASSVDVIERIEALSERATTGESVSWASAPLRTGPDLTEAHVTISHSLAQPTWILDAPLGSEVNLEAESSGDIGLNVLTPDGYWALWADEGLEGLESGSFEVEIAGPHFIMLQSFEDEPIEAILRSDFPFAALAEQNDGIPLQTGTVHAGSIDYVGDFDHFVVDLERNTEITIAVESMSIDPYVCIGLAPALEEPVACDDDSGGGLFGTNSQVTLVTEEAGSYLISVEDAYWGAVGGYLISIEAAVPTRPID